MRRFQVLSRDTKVFGRFFLEASAGTGKTFAIEHIAVRALLESQDLLTIDQILIVTFTKAATRELRLRLRQNLMKTLLILQTGHGGPDYLQPIFEQGAHALFSSQRKIEEALCNFDKASIFTLHGFCHKMLTECAFESGESIQIDPVDSMTYLDAIYQVVEDVFRIGLDPSRYSPSQIAGVMGRSSNGMQGLIKKIIPWVEKQVFIPQSVGFSDLIDQCNEKLALVSAGYVLEKDLFVRDLQDLLALYKKTKEVHIQQGIRFFEVLKNREISYPELDYWIGLKDCFLSFIHPENLKKGKDPSHITLHYPDLFQKLSKTLLPLIEQGSDAELNFLRIIKECIETWKGCSAYQESFSPDELLRKMVGALAKPLVKEKISAKYAIGIVDEFQDTDPIQWQIFKTLFLDQEKNLKTIYLVGDPKQSIYSFRNADVYTYLQAMNTLGTEHRLFLDTNFRSDPSLVGALNILFTQDIAKQWMPLPSTQEFLEVRSVLAKEDFSNEVETKERGSIHFFIGQGSCGRSKKWPSVKLEEDQLLAFIVLEIQRMYEAEGFRLGQFAILVRDRFQAARMEDSLKKSGIACSVKRSFSVDESAAYLALYDLIHAVIYYDDTAALKKVLGGVFIGMQAHDLIGGMELESLQEAKSYFQAAKYDILKKGWGAFFSQFLASCWNGDSESILERILSREDRSLYFDVRQLLQIIQQSLSVDLFSLDRFYAFYKSLAHLDPDDEILKVSAESEEDQVIIMTIHASKGLEFDIVFALGLVSRSSAIDEIIKTKENGMEGLEKADLSKESCLTAILEIDAEKMRHLYVALTRAKTRVYIPVAIDLDQKRVEISCASSIELLCQSFGKESFNLIEAYENIHLFSSEILARHLDRLSKLGSISYSLLKDTTLSSWSKDMLSDEKDLVFAPAFDRIFRSEKILSFSSIHQNEMKSSLATLATEEISDHILPLGAETGTVLHRILELVIQQGLHHPYNVDGIAHLVDEHTRTGNLAPFQGAISDMIYQTMHLPLSSNFSSFCLADIPSKDFFIEMEFAFEFSGNMMKGFIDGVFLFDKKIYILDWKTNYLGYKSSDYLSDKIAVVMQEQGYFLQAAIYAEALKRYLTQLDLSERSLSFGGAFYLFLRGNAPFYFLPDPSLLRGIEKGDTIRCS
ncbi:MAG: hypothetical protein EB051_03165 [Chlamydiia bacterium]|nr:hypothetical protein [Chlamydiia bacterium]